MLCISIIVMAQNITIMAVDEPAAAVFRNIIGQTGKNFVYSSDLLDGMRVTVVADNLPLKQVLSIMFKDSDIKWKIKGNNVIIKKKNSKG